MRHNYHQVQWVSVRCQTEESRSGLGVIASARASIRRLPEDLDRQAVVETEAAEDAVGAWPGLGWPGLAAPNLAWPGLAWPGGP